MLEINALGDGNCFYNSVAIWLLHTHQQKKLTQLIQNHGASFVALLDELYKQNPEIDLPKLQQHAQTDDINAALEAYIRSITIDDEIDWITGQRTVAKALRAFVVNKILNDQEIYALAKAELSVYLDNICESSDEIGLMQRDLTTFRLELLAHLNTFEPQDNAPKKLAELKKFVIKGFEDFINEKIAASTQKKETVTGLVKDEFNKVVKDTVSCSKKRNFNAIFNEVKEAIYVAAETHIANDAENESVNISSHFSGMKEMQDELNIIMSNTDESPQEKQEALKAWFFGKENTGLKLYINGANGIAKDGVEAGDFEQKIISHTLGAIFDVKYLKPLSEKQNKKQEEGNQVKRTYLSRIVNGFKTLEEAKNYPKDTLVFYVKKLPNHWNVLLPVTAANKKLASLYNRQHLAALQTILRSNEKIEKEEILKEYGSFKAHHENVLNELSESEYCNLLGLTQHEYQNKQIKESKDKGSEPKNKARKEKAAKVAFPPRDWTNYGLLLLTFTSIAAIVTHGLWPLVQPLAGFILGSNVATSTFGVIKYVCISLFSSLSGFLITEKLHADNEVIIAQVVARAKNSDKPMQFPKPTLLSLFQTKDNLPEYLAQDRDQEPMVSKEKHQKTGERQHTFSQ